MTLKQLTFLIILAAFSCSGFAQLKWTRFSDLNDSLKNKQKPLVIFIYTNWCKVCKMQENAVIANPEIAKLMNSKAYALKLNAEGKEEISFLGKEYLHPGADKFHDLAVFLGTKFNELSFPTTVTLNNKLQAVGVYNHYINKKTFKELLMQLE